jgi:hypothetical protein
VVTEVSSKEDADIDAVGRQVLLVTNNYQAARKECIEWAAYDDILVHVVDQFGYPNLPVTEPLKPTIVIPK